jgi:hypothetical protein
VITLGLILVVVVIRRKRRNDHQMKRLTSTYLTNDLVTADSLQTAYRHDMTIELRHDCENPIVEIVTIVESDDDNLDELI